MSRVACRSSHPWGRLTEVRYLLSPACAPVLERLAQERTLCAFDFDGTLAPIVEHPNRAAMRPETKESLARLAASFPVVILSGRAGGDVAGRLDGVPVERILGNHGAELMTRSDAALPKIQRWHAELQEEIGTTEGVWIEDKGLSLAVHYRQAPEKAEARRRILTAAREIGGARVFAGKQVVNLTMPNAPHKGAALAAERDRLRCNWALFVGDDDNDEDAFGIDGNLVATRVGKSRRSRARYYLRNQLEIDPLLDRLAMLRNEAIHANMTGAL